MLVQGGISAPTRTSTRSLVQALGESDHDFESYEHANILKGVAQCCRKGVPVLQGWREGGRE